MMVKAVTKPKTAEAAANAAATAPRPLACLVVEDHTLIGQLLVGVLRSSPGIGAVSLATTAAGAISEAAGPDLDLLILDLKLPDGDGLEVLRAIASRHPEVRCIVLSSMADEFACPADLARHMAASIDKTAPIDELRLEVGAVVRSRLGDWSEGGLRNPATDLRPRELEVFELIGKGMTSRRIAEALGISVHTASTHRRAIASKLGVSGAELVRLATLHNQTR
jgi:DNA-binding NarL/FixJ family response regulator